MTDHPRLIEHVFPLKQASIDSVHEKNVRHGHISTLHIWPARRPLAACRAALVATLLADPENDEDRRRLLEKLGGKVVQSVKKKRMPGGRLEETKSEETVGGILHWGLESAPDLGWFRDEIRKAFGGRAPRVMDPFAGGGAIPLEAMRLGCEVTAADLNPVAWMLLKCTLEYPQRLVGEKRPLPEFARKDRELLEKFFAAQGMRGAAVRTQLERLGLDGGAPLSFAALFEDDRLLEAGLSWHVRAWGREVLRQVRSELGRFYPMIDGKPTVAYLWARTVRCKGCRATLPLLKTRWLCKKDHKRVLLAMQPNDGKTGVVFDVRNEVPGQGGNAAQRREHDKRLGEGTMTRSGAKCPCCPAMMTMEDIRLEGRAGRLDAVMTAVVVDGPEGKEFRRPEPNEIEAAGAAAADLEKLFADIPYGLPNDPTPRGGNGASRAFSVGGYGLDTWSKLFTPRQLVAIGTLVCATRRAAETIRDTGEADSSWVEALWSYLALALDRAANYMSTLCIWDNVAGEVKQTFLRFALPITWDFAEANPLSLADRYYAGAVSRVASVLDGLLEAQRTPSPPPIVRCQSALVSTEQAYDLVLTDPPYYDAIPYSDLMDFFYVWLRRVLHGHSTEMDEAFEKPLGPKWNHQDNDGELIDDSSRHAGDGRASRRAYEDGMAVAFERSLAALRPSGRMVVVFPNKQPAAWEALVSALIRAGATVDATWPIATEMRGGVRNFGRASLGSSVWLVCKKRPEDARPGWDNRVLEDMRERIGRRLREFWDAGIRGPDFVWAATGPALEAYSRHPVVKKADSPGELMSVTEFLQHVRRIVVDFVVGRVLTGDGDASTVSGLDDVTTYSLLHRHDFGLGEAPIGPCILYAVSCGLSDSELSGPLDVLVRKGGAASVDAEETEELSEEDAEGGGGGSQVRLKTWQQRSRRTLGFEGPGGRPPPLIDQVHRLMHLWKAGDRAALGAYIESRELRHSTLFPHILQALIELSEKEERAILESLSNYLQSLGVRIATTKDWIRG